MISIRMTPPLGVRRSIASLILILCAMLASGPAPALASIWDDSSLAARAIPPGSFNLINWAKYPSWAPKPTGTLRVLSGAEYDAARKAANAANAALRRADPAAYAGKQIHEIIPVKFGGSPTNIANKIAVTPAQHAELTNFWNQLMRGLP